MSSTNVADASAESSIIMGPGQGFTQVVRTKCAEYSSVYVEATKRAIVGTWARVLEWTQRSIVLAQSCRLAKWLGVHMLTLGDSRAQRSVDPGAMAS